MNNRKSTESNEDPLIGPQPDNQVSYSKSESALDESSHRSTLLEEAPSTISGYLWKKQAKQFYSAWDRRFVVLDGSAMLFFEDEKKKREGKVIDLTKANYVSFHYDEDAPIKSKRLSNKEKDESRFDVYTPDRIFMLRSDGNSVFEANSWVETIQRAAKKHSRQYGK